MASTTDEGFHEIQLNGKQLVFLFIAVTVVSVVIFLCGVLVGRGLPSDRLAAEELTSDLVPPAPDPPALSVTTGSAAPATAGEDLSYPSRLVNAEPSKDQLPAAPAPRVETVTPAPQAEAAAPAAASPPPPVPAPAQPAPAAAPPAGSGFVIQVAALRQRQEADVMVRRLEEKGYPAFVVAPDAGAPAVFRVRVGKFKDRREAESVATRLQKEEQFKPWIVP
ncbi:MAG: SPOR domain-containing protein [Acidobacteriota bacterium]